ncbi:hypothetical protein GQ457_10G013770 [Hibiscus cannabinus]
MLNTSIRRNCSKTWKGIIKNLSSGEVDSWMNNEALYWQLYDGKSILFWKDCRCEKKPLWIIFKRLYKLVLRKASTVADLTTNGYSSEISWDHVFSRPLLGHDKLFLNDLKLRVARCRLTVDVPNRLIWPHEKT